MSQQSGLAPLAPTQEAPTQKSSPGPTTSDAVAVLVVDDDRLERAAIEAALGNAEACDQVVCVESIAAARHAIATQTFTLALVDYYLGDGLGLDLIRECKDLPMVIITGAGNEEIAVEAMHAGAYDYLVKDLRSGYLSALPATVGHVVARKKAELAAETRSVELARANQELEEFAYVVSHDLKAPLRSIRGFVHLLIEDAGERLEEADLSHLARIDRSADHMDSLIRELLDYSRIGRSGLRAQSVDVASIFAEVAAEAEAADSERTGNTVRAVSELHPVMATPVRLRQLLQNLIGNAKKFCGEGPALVEVSSERRGSAVEYCVSDNGIGIEACNLHSIFRVFHRVGRADEYEGSGIGLSVCKKICEQHGGTIWAESVAGKGTQIYFRLPAAPDEKPALPS